MKKIILILIAVALALPCAGAEWAEVPRVGNADISLAPEIEETPEPSAFDKLGEDINILLVGIDARPKETTGRSDTMILMTIDKSAKTIKLISFMRDLYVKIPGKGSNRLNAAYRYGGAELLFQTLENNFGVSADKYVTVNFSELSELIDQIGGLELTVESDYIMDRINAVIKMDNKALGIDINKGLIKAPGTQTLTGRQVLGYARYRYGSSDFKRTERQREVIVKALEKIKSEYSPMQLIALATKNMDAVQTNLTAAEIISLAPLALDIDFSAATQLRIPIDGGYSSETVSGMAVLVPNSKNAKAITDFLAE